MVLGQLQEITTMDYLGEGNSLFGWVLRENISITLIFAQSSVKRKGKMGHAGILFTNKLITL